MTFDAGKPAAGIPARQLDNDIRDNNVFLVTALEQGHNFTSGSGTGWHKSGSAQMYSGSSTPTTKEDGVTVFTSDDYYEKIWLDESTSPAIAKVLTGASTFTPLAQLIGMLDEDDLVSDSDEFPATQQSLKKYTDDGQLLDVKLTGSTMSGVLNMGSNLISAVTDPLSAQDAATKAYVDSFDNIERFAGTYTGDQTTNNTSDMTNAQSVTGLGFDPNEVLVMSESDTKQSFFKTSTMGVDDAMGLGNDVYTDLIIEFIPGGFKVNRRNPTVNQSCNTNSEVYHFVAKKHA